MKELEMRRKLNGKKYSRKFNKAHRRTRALNRPSAIARGGFRF
ncbi:MAG: hypothetical protein [Arizlama microvirus]|nr:MAG: hypothetical protein [Arizlama microvirus]